MKLTRTRGVLLAFCLLLLVGLATSRWTVPAYWRAKSDHPVRRGVTLATELGCFTCHGELGGGGIPDPGGVEDVPQWDGSVWMMYVKSDEEIRRFIVEGSQPDDGPAGPAAIPMPAYGDRLDERGLDDLVAAFKALSGMVAPARGTPARAGYDVAREWRCFSCHGPAGSGGLANPGSFAGFIPGWYGADFRDLVRDREEFDRWIVEGTIPRLADHPIARRFLRRQAIAMPAYPGLTPEHLDSLWAFVEWLDETEGGHRGEISQW